MEAIHSRLQDLLKSQGAHVDGFFFCPHDSRECNCRKPLPRLFGLALSEFPTITAGTSVMIGDSLSDIEFGRRLGMKTVFIDGDSGRQKSGAPTAGALADLRFPSLPEAVDCMLKNMM